MEALKRALARLGYMAWKGNDFTQVWPAGGELDKAFRKWERDKRLPGDGVYGEQEWKLLRYGEGRRAGRTPGKPALDAYACKLIRPTGQARTCPTRRTSGCGTHEVLPDGRAPTRTPGITRSSGPSTSP